MYSIKEKMKLLRELHNPEHAEADLHLLHDVSPQNDLFRSPIVNAARSAEKILYTLLDHTTADKIRLNRRGMEVEKQPENKLQNENPDDKKPEDTDAIQSNPAEHPEGDTPKDTGEDHPDGDTDKADVTQLLQEATEALEETKEELDNTQSELEETQDALEDAHAELDATKEELNAEKKSEPAPVPAPKNSKKKTSTRKSTGKTSSTKTSRSPRSSTTTA
ncbi:hypothetical protein M1P97_19905 [Parabacteroides sp. GYB001]|uniref:coiled-coil domain-containing protein n=1 Tax=Parabacteroides leei TaxID=2939491 RepID=UPI0020180C86|nr:hypothetical protein [Parabacteroides leei]MCL3853551.1 hypothetical protein [Parabacteroides leei]